MFMVLFIDVYKIFSVHLYMNIYISIIKTDF